MPGALPVAGREVLASYDPHSVVVWQAHRPEVAEEALRHQRFGGPAWRTDRVTRLRLSLPSLLARSAWGTREGRERILAVRLRRSGFDAILRQAVPAEFDPAVYASKAAWHLATRFANVTVGWHRDVDAGGVELDRQTPRIGLREHALRAFTEEWVVAVEDLTPWVEAHRGEAAPTLPVTPVEPYLLGVP